MIGHIYCIKSKQTTDIYVGSTKKTIKERLQSHKDSYSKWLNNKKYGYITSFEILKYDDYYIELIETIEYNEDAELTEKEAYYIRTMNCVNIVIPHRTKKQYDLDNKEQIKQYYLDNKEKIAEKLAEKIVCECGSIFSRGMISKHIKTQKHITFLETNKI